MGSFKSLKILERILDEEGFGDKGNFEIVSIASEGSVDNELNQTIFEKRCFSPRDLSMSFGIEYDNIDGNGFEISGGDTGFFLKELL